MKTKKLRSYISMLAIVNHRIVYYWLDASIPQSSKLHVEIYVRRWALDDFDFGPRLPKGSDPLSNT